MKYGPGSLPAALALAIAIATMASPGQAQDSALDKQKQVRNRVVANGSLHGFAIACKLPEAERERLYILHAVAARSYARELGANYAASDFERDYVDGIQETVTLAARSPAEAHARNCPEIEEKVRSLLAAKSGR